MEIVGAVLGLRLTAGVYASESSLLLSATLILDGQGDPNSVFIFKAGSTLTAATVSSVELIGRVGHHRLCDLGCARRGQLTVVPHLDTFWFACSTSQPCAGQH